MLCIKRNARAAIRSDTIKVDDNGRKRADPARPLFFTLLIISSIQTETLKELRRLDVVIYVLKVLKDQELKSYDQTFRQAKVNDLADLTNNQSVSI